MSAVLPPLHADPQAAAADARTGLSANSATSADPFAGSQVDISADSSSGSRTFVIAEASRSATTTQRATNPRSRWRLLLPWALPVVLIGAWQYFSAIGRLPAGILPAPLDVFRAAAVLAERGELQRDILVSLRRVGIGFFTGAATGLVLGFIVGLSSIAHGLLDRSLQMVRTIPHLALVPLMILWFGIGEEPRVLLVAMGTLFPVYLNTVSGIRNVDPKLVELGKSYGLGPSALIAGVVLPGALPAILTGIRYALGVAWLTLVVGETIASRDGIGYMVQNARELLRTDVILLAILLYALAGWLADTITRGIESWLLRWHPNYAKGGAA